MRDKKNLYLFLVGLILIVALMGLTYKEELWQWWWQPTPLVGVEIGKQLAGEDLANLQSSSSSSSDIDDKSVEAGSSPTLQVLASELAIPWELAFLPNNDLLITQRSGQLLRLTAAERELVPVAGVYSYGEGGLLGMALHPNFTNKPWIYLYSTTKTDVGVANRVERYTWRNNSLQDREVIVADIPGAVYHDGGRIAFGPDGYLYIGTGDANQSELAQDANSLAGKILRVADDGSTPADNPFANLVYSYGHRNVQGLAWDANGQLWATEHGPSGTQTGYDEVNKITKGGNYGWPAIKGDEQQAGMISPLVNSGNKSTWAPAGAVVWQDNLFFVGLRGQALYQLPLAAGGSNLTAHFVGQLGRLRTVTIGPDGWLYLLTNNTDGRGAPATDDDKLLRLNPAFLSN